MIFLSLAWRLPGAEGCKAAPGSARTIASTLIWAALATEYRQTYKQSDSIRGPHFFRGFQCCWRAIGTTGVLTPGPDLPLPAGGVHRGGDRPPSGVGAQPGNSFRCGRSGGRPYARRSTARPSAQPRGRVSTSRIAPRSGRSCFLHQTPHPMAPTSLALPLLVGTQPGGVEGLLNRRAHSAAGTGRPAGRPRWRRGDDSRGRRAAARRSGGRGRPDRVGAAGAAAAATARAPRGDVRGIVLIAVQALAANACATRRSMPASAASSGAARVIIQCAGRGRFVRCGARSPRRSPAS